MDIGTTVWNEILDNLSNKLDDMALSLWFRPVKISAFSETSVTLLAENDLKSSFLKNRYQALLEEEFRSALGYAIEVKIVSAESQNEESGGFNEIPIPQPQKKPPEAPTEDETLRMARGYTFENFVIGSSNRVAQAGSYAVASDPAVTINPLFIYGSSGLGKTHLLFAIINEIKRLHPNYRVLYTTGEQFGNEIIDAIAHKETIPFREKYRTVDVLLVDDIQFIAGKPTTQEEFFHTFDTLYKMQKQIILTSDKPPKDISQLEERMTTRFEMGLITDIQPPDTELRAAIFKLKTNALGLDIPNDVITYLAENITKNIRQIEGAIKKLWAQSFITGTSITLEMAKSVLNDYFKQNTNRTLTPDTIFDFISKRYDISREDMMSKKRTNELVYARHIAMYLTQELTDLSIVRIGKLFDRHHSTVISARDNVEKRMKKDPDFEKEIKEIIKELTEVGSDKK